ncbi:hypothetical protein F5144DRAFT_228809 [Chaetomium tenue]|uniref:Uncharacterized protein n=1 Tax=Chaetomium tenue TaxID=1854479 RepID=A0ACB7P969_9PEZI|nr:hypothetical protein F5144DRAFT_228809 [Chaetomium globosum]
MARHAALVGLISPPGISSNVGFVKKARILARYSGLEDQTDSQTRSPESGNIPPDLAWATIYVSAATFGYRLLSSCTTNAICVSRRLSYRSDVEERQRHVASGTSCTQDTLSNKPSKACPVNPRTRSWDRTEGQARRRRSVRWSAARGRLGGILKGPWK